MYQSSRLFEGVTQQEFKQVMSCIRAYEKSYAKNSYIIMQGDRVTSFGMVTEGSVDVIKENIYGTRRLIATIEKDMIFAESLAASGLEESPISAIAREDCKVLFIPIDRLLVMCATSCPFHSRLITNMVRMLAVKNLILNQKLDYLTSRTTRERIAKYFIDTANREGKTRIKIPYNRNQLAEYLGVDRSVLSRELSKLKKEGILDFEKNTFQIVDVHEMSMYYS
ncbi:MAG: Crp/Fnr family transcriptional regulator [Clostridia bacterium]|nr:Crp/Fnr family transcriptional regulator [Clostridia bacterium]